MFLPYVCRTMSLYMKGRKKEGMRSKDQSLPQPHLLRVVYIGYKGFYSFSIELVKKEGVKDIGK